MVAQRGSQGCDRHLNPLILEKFIICYKTPHLPTAIVSRLENPDAS
ncbi:hypothetical protein POG22_18595 [Geitlerinema sp. CS-897]|nr:hypothetical protein [Geitlerinema sp. CS-897]